ncbi:MAG TPA: GntR family transcriptional regulator [Candidatus Limnocylindrales bacterium]|nr:GntR family transcriptional regulator [Candidatus Limnocylindrales bacterium]
MAGTVRRSVLSGSLAEQVYRQLRADIIVGRYRAGAKLVELDLAQKTGTSQGTVREALQRLEREGLVDRHAHRATYVTDVDTEAVHELFIIRATIEGIAVRRALRFMTAQDIEHLEALWLEMRQAGTHNDIAILVEHDMEFHRCICRLSRSSVLLSTWQPLYAQIQRFIVQTHPRYFLDLNSLADTHISILDSIKAGDPEEAARVLQDHVLLIWKWIDKNAPISAKGG